MKDKVTRISATKEDIERLAFATLQLANYERIGVTGPMFDNLLQAVEKRKAKIGPRDLHLLAREIENLIISEAIHTCGTSCCGNCLKVDDCAEFEAVTAAGIERNVHDRNAAANCARYAADRSVFDKMSETVPPVLMLLEGYALPVNKKQTLEKVLVVAGSWMAE